MKLCKDCINWLEIDPKKLTVECDFDKFTKTKIQQAQIFVPELFQCEEWEKRPD